MCQDLFTTYSVLEIPPTIGIRCSARLGMGWSLVGVAMANVARLLY